MTAPHDLAEIQTVFFAAIDLPPGERAGFVEARCANRPALRAEVESLLASHAEAGGILDVPAVDRDGSLVGLRVGAFRLVREIGRGGMSVVYLGERVEGDFAQQAAVKILDAPLRHQDVLQRFRAERQILATFAHPNIVSLLDGGVTAGGHAFLVMELVDGEPLTRYCGAGGVALEDRLLLIQQVCAAVQHAHQHGVVHRDLKPANILVTAGGVVKVLDFGVAKLLDDAPGAPANATLATGLRPLTPNYAAPEQLRGLPVTTATDIYALGVLTYELVAGVRPYDISTQTLDVILKTITEIDPPKPSLAAAPEGSPYDPVRLRGDLDAIVFKAMSKDPADRYGSAQQLAADLTRYASSEPVDARPPSVGYVLAKLARRHRAAFLAAALSLVALLAALGVSIRQTRRAERRFEDVRTLAHALLFDVYDAISGVPGTLGPRRLVAGRAQEYLDRLAREAGNDSVLERELAESYLRLGDVRGKPYRSNLGDTAGALESYQKGVLLLEDLLRRHPSDPAIEEELAKANMDAAIIFMRQEKANESIAAANRAIALAQDLTNRAPRSATFNEELATAYLRLGQAQAVAADRGGSVEDLQQVVATYRKGLADLQADGAHTEPFWQARLSELYFYVGYPLGGLGARTGNVAYYKEALESSLSGDAINRRLVAADTRNAEYVRKYADGILTIGSLRWQCCRDLEGALRDVREAADIFQRIVDRDSQNVEARRDLANAYSMFGVLLQQADRSSEAEDMNRKALALYEQVARADPTSAEDAKYVDRMRTRIAALERATMK